MVEPAEEFTQGTGVGDQPWVAIAANPFSGSGPTQKRVSDLADALAELGLVPRIIWDKAERAAILSRPDLSRSCRCVVAAGGDGTVADVINELCSSVPLATLPSGNENLFAREFGFTRNVAELARRIVRGSTRVIDLGRAGHRMFSLMLSAGFDAEVVHRVAAWRTQGAELRRVKRLSYAKPIVRALRNYDYGRLELEADGNRYEGAHALVFNLPQYGFQLPFAPDARGDDGWLDWVLFQRPGLGPLLRYALAVLRGRHRGRPDVSHGRARLIRISSPEPVPIQLDGDAAGFTPVSIEVVPQALRVVVDSEVVPERG